MNKAVDYISAGGDIEAIKSKYKLTSRTRKTIKWTKIKYYKSLE
jgi:hypothetical protein